MHEDVEVLEEPDWCCIFCAINDDTESIVMINHSTVCMIGAFTIA